MFDAFQSQLGKLLGKGDADPAGGITADQLKVVLQSIETKYNQLKEANQRLLDETSEQRTTIGALENQASLLRGQLDARPAGPAPEELAAARAELAIMTDAHAKLQAALSVQEALVQSLREELTELRAQPAPEAVAGPEVNVDLDALMAENQVLLDQLGALESERENLIIVKEAAEQRAIELQARQGEMDALVARLELDKAEAEERARSRAAEVSRLTDEVARLEATQEAVDQLEGRVEALLTQLEQSQAEKQVLQSRLEALAEEAASPSARERTEMEAQLKRLTDELREAGEQIGALREVKVKSMLDLEEARSELETHRREVDSLRAEIATLRRAREAAPPVPAPAPAAAASPRAKLGARKKPAGPQPPAETPAAPAPAAPDTVARRRALLSQIINENRDA